MAKKRLMLVDAMAQIYRAHFAMSRTPLFTRTGENVSAVFGFTNTLLSLIEREKPDLLAVVYDTKEPTLRHHIFPEYKATREKMPEELAEQLPRMDQVLDVLKITKLILPGYEADDIIGTLSRQADTGEYEVQLVTGDKDYYQLVTENVVFYNNTKGANDIRVLGPADVETTFGVLPENVVDVLGLAGDTSDNVPGVPKVGPKTAIKLVKEYGSLEKVLSNAESVKGVVGQNLVEFREQALLSKNLVTIRTEAPIEVDLETLTYGPWENDAKDLFVELEFRTLLRTLAIEPQSVDEQAGKVKYKSITTERALERLVKELSGVAAFAIDTETTSLNAVEADLVGISICYRAGEAWYIPVNHFQFEGETAPLETGRPIVQLKEAAQRILEKMKSVLEGGPGKIAQHAKYDFQIFRQHGIHCGPLSFETMLADYLLNPVARGHGLDSMSLNHLNIKKIPTEELIGSGKNQITMDRVPLKIITKYACEDADMTFRLAQFLKPRIDDEKLTDLLVEVEQPLSDVLMKMEGRGVSLNVEFLKTMSVRMHARLMQLEKECHELAGVEFNLKSPKQLAHILFEKMGYPTKLSKKTKTGFSTNQAVLEKLAPLGPLPQKIVEHRELAKLVGTYIDALPELVSKFTGRLHTSYHQTVASTGRLSSSDPNLQNIPIRTEAGAEIRKAFVAKDGYKLLSADYSQIELRMMAHLSGDQELIEAFERGDDIHSATASKIFDVPIEEVSKEQRSASKAVNFGVLFGMREFGLSSRMHISVEQAREFIEGYFGAFPRVKQFIDNLLVQAHKDGYVETILGRRRPLPELATSNKNVVQAAERVAIASVVQGSAADLIKLAMLKLDKDIEKNNLPYEMLLQVHDELIFEIPEGQEEEAFAFIRERMESAMELSVPIIVDAGWGDNWLEAH